ncbi:hypothetical protein JAAARDRAFT_27822 [Jaapia argillacea MUCL 33604]|uniref:Uncharacterized protein n=1 Tax=Jaapia argillacea MUCL 33604 TaxID=933084 RepID=A0A067QNH8_9AGAM|nr:hypothetical protein JAAARDRAFT_27822 [Jaapia argillacea MUCL 33604]
MLGALVNKPNRVLEKQHFYQSSTKPIYRRHPASRVYLGVYFTAFTVGVLGSTYGIFTLIRGKQA